MRRSFHDARSISEQLELARQIEGVQHEMLARIVAQTQSIRRCIEQSRRLIQESKESMQEITARLHRMV